MNKDSTFKNKLFLNLGIINIIFVISAINSFNFIKETIEKDSFADNLLYLIGFSFIPIIISIICLLRSKKSENKYKIFSFYVSILTIIFLFIESLIIILI